MVQDGRSVQLISRARDAASGGGLPAKSLCFLKGLVRLEDVNSIVRQNLLLCLRGFARFTSLHPWSLAGYHIPMEC